PVTFDADDADSEPSPPLAKATDWVNVELDLGDGPKQYRRDTNVMPPGARERDRAKDPAPPAAVSRRAREHHKGLSARA
ncbi:hypothetical protein, partial [Isoptericola sp. NPDC060257]|uniref:hypothetical protein n=1 Tax=Isoptericola sp. NPDC060257 TaxID=3347087 RepID=UPI00365139C8